MREKTEQEKVEVEVEVEAEVGEVSGSISTADKSEIS